jgi:hypothetical protein
VVEEVELHKDVEERDETIRDTLRRTDVEVEEYGAGRMQTSGTADFTGSEDYFRNHFQTTYAGTDYTYDQVRPYYEYGYGLAGEERYRGRIWQEVEMAARQDWERSHPDSLWDDIKDAIRAGWESVQGRR